QPLWKQVVPIAIATILTLILSFFLFNKQTDSITVPTMQFEVEHPLTPAENQFAISPDGSYLISVVEARGSGNLWLRSFRRGIDQFLKGTERASDPFWSPDGRFIGFFSEGRLKKMDVIGGPPQPLSEAVNNGGSWSQDGVILFSLRNAGPLYRIPASGGTP